MPNWLLDGIEIDDGFNPEEYEGFVYEITYTDGTKYVGKKSFWSTYEKEVLQKGRKRAGHIEFVGRNRGGKRVTRERHRKEMNWRKYNGSSAYTDGKEIEAKKILILCETKIDLTYWETHTLMILNVLFDENYLNMNCLGKFYAGQITGSKEHTKGE